MFITTTLPEPYAENLGTQTFPSLALVAYCNAGSGNGQKISAFVLEDCAYDNFDYDDGKLKCKQR